MNTSNKENILHKELNYIFVYIFIAIIGFLIVFCMVNFLNKKVSEFNDDVVAQNM